MNWNVPCAVASVALRSLLFCLLSAASRAQTAPPAKTSAASDEPVELAPFTVNSTTDVGYLAGNTLAGSRLNTPLKDTAASISVMTAEFLSDIGALDLNQALAYAANTQQELSEEGPQGNRLLEFQNTFRIRGVNASLARNYFVWKIPSDTYNVERVDQSRGPNSILFGIGSAGGIVNTSTKQPVLGRAFRSVGTVVGSDELYRGTLDINQPFANKKAGVRFNAVWEEAGSFKQFAYKHTKAAHLAARWLPTSRTTIRVEGEKGVVDDNSARPWTLFDSVSTWEDAGRPTLATPVADPVRGLARYAAGAARITYIENSNRLLDLRGAMLSNRPTPAPANDFLILDTAVADHSINTGGPGSERTNDYHTYTATIEQRFGDNTFLELAYNRQYSDFIGYDPGVNAHRFTADPNATLPTGGANPFAGGYFLESNWSRRWRRESADYYRVTASTAHDFGKFGSYRIAGLFERQDSLFQRDQKIEMWAGLPYSPNIADTQNNVWRRSYVTLHDWGTYRINGGKGQLISGMVDPMSGRTLSSVWLQPNQTIDDDPTQLDSFLGGLEARYFKNRLVAMLGYRRDDLHIVNNGAILDPARGEFVVDYRGVLVNDFKIDTKSLGLVAHVLPWLSLHGNFSTNNALPNVAHRILPDDLNPTGAEGEGKDVGFAVTLPGNKAYFKASYYTTVSANDTDFRNFFGISFRGREMLDGLVSSGQIPEATAAGRRRFATAGTYDREADGYELELVANPTPNWRISANYTRSNVVEDNVGNEAVAWSTELVSFVRGFNTAAVTPSGLTIEETIAFQAGLLNELTSTNGKGAIGNRRHKGSLVTRYGFTSGALKNAFVGGGIRYQSGATAGRAATGDLLYGTALTIADAFVGYRTKVFRDRTTLSLQLNIGNLFDFDDPQITVVSPTGGVRRFQIVPPRSFRLSAKFDW